MYRQSVPLALAAALAVLGSSAALAFDKAQPPPPKPSPSPAKATPPKPVAKLVDINVARRGELKTLPGIGDAEAAKIVAGRPYMTKTGLVEKKVLTLEAYDALRHRIVVVHKGPPPKTEA
jgi:DNA uptake protein ComE-like DNA-binding protein